MNIQFNRKNSFGQIEEKQGCYPIVTFWIPEDLRWDRIGARVLVFWQSLTLEKG